MKLTAEQLKALDEIQAHAATIEGLRRRVNAIQADLDLPFKPVFLCALSHLVDAIDRALWEHRRASNTPAARAEQQRRELVKRATA
jgi:hypothetical protein